MKKGWEIKKLGEVYDVRDGTHDSPKYVSEGYALITSKNLKNDNLNYDGVNYITEQDYVNINKRSKVDVGDVLFAMIGTIGNPIVISNEPDFAIKNVALFKVPKNQDSYFLKYYLDSSIVIERMSKDAKGATQKFVGLGYLRNFEIPLPPLPEQQRIVAILDEAFAAIAKAKANAEQNLKNAKELFESYLQNTFSQNHRLNGLNDSTDLKSMKSKKSVSSEQSDKIRDSDNDGWELKTIGDVCASASSNVSQNKLANDEGDYPIFGASGLIKNVSFYHRGKPYLSIVKDGSGVGRVTKMEAFTSIIGTLQYILPKENIDLDYLNYSLMSVDFKKYVAGAAIPHIYFKDYKNEPFLWMPLPEQQTIVQKLDALSAETKKLESIYQQKINDLEELKKSVLQKAFSGQLSESRIVTD